MKFDESVKLLAFLSCIIVFSAGGQRLQRWSLRLTCWPPSTVWLCKTKGSAKDLQAAKNAGSKSNCRRKCVC